MRFPIKITETRTSEVFSGKDAWHALNDIIEELPEKNVKSFILVDDNTERFCLPLLLSHVPGLRNSVIMRICPGEISKTPETAAMLWNELAAMGAARDSLLINLGGGVVTDLGGFVASTYKRGIPFIHVPTTLMAMADAAIGGKSAVNLQKGKNAIGAFNLPLATTICPEFLKTLNHAELSNGLAEIFKIALVADQAFWEYLKSTEIKQLLSEPFDEQAWEEIISRSTAIKNRIVEKDFFDQHERALLNFGHTIGHVFETFSHQQNREQISHGRAVSMGILCECYLSMRCCGFSESDFAEITGLFLSVFDYYPLNNADIPEILGYMDQDKKVSHGMLNFTLLKHPGEGVIKQVCPQDLILESLEFYQQLNVKQ